MQAFKWVVWQSLVWFHGRNMRSPAKFLRKGFLIRWTDDDGGDDEGEKANHNPDLRNEQLTRSCLRRWEILIRIDRWQSDDLMMKMMTWFDFYDAAAAAAAAEEDA